MTCLRIDYFACEYTGLVDLNLPTTKPECQAAVRNRRATNSTTVKPIAMSTASNPPTPVSGTALVLPAPADELATGVRVGEGCGVGLP